MSFDAGADGNTDCELVAKLWDLLESPSSGEYYLGNIIRNGLDVPSIGIHIAPFSTIAVGDVPEQTMFRFAADYLGVSMSRTEIEGLGSFSGGEMNCTPVSADETAIDLDLNFSSVSFTGAYEVAATGATACAIATASTILGGAGAGATDRLALAAWYETDGLDQSENGQVAVGTYYLHEDTIESVTTADSDPSRQYRQALARQKASADRVTAATLYWKEQQTGEHPSGDPPKIGSASQYGGGFQTYAALLQAVEHARTQRGLALEPGNDYAELQNAMTQMLGQVKAFQKNRPGEHDAGEIMGYVANAQELSPTELKELDIEGIPVHDQYGGEVIDHVPTWPLDRDRALAAHAARAPRREAIAPKFSFKVQGTFKDAGRGVTLGASAKFKSDANGLVADVTSLRVTISNLQIELGNREGWSSQPTLYDKVTNWIANTQAFQDTLKAKITAAVNTPAVLGAVTDTLNAGLKKLGFQG
jgi:hypothetical protein